jgi:WD40 repeat protein
MRGFTSLQRREDLCSFRERGEEGKGQPGASRVAPGGHGMLDSSATAARAHDGAVTGLLQTPDGRHWVSAGADNAARVWDVRSWRNCLVRFPGALNSARAARQIAVDDSGQVGPCWFIPWKSVSLHL